MEIAPSNIFSCEPISSSPEIALRASLALRIIYSLFVWAADDALGHGHRLHSGLPQPTDDVPQHCCVLPQIACFRRPLLQLRLRTLVAYYSQYHFGGTPIVGAVEGDRANWKSLIALA